MSANVFETKWCGKKKAAPSASPTEATESIIIIAEIDATEGRDIAVIDFSGAFLTAEMDKEVIVISENEMFDAMLEIDKEIYRKYVIHRKNGKNKGMFASARQCTER